MNTLANIRTSRWQFWIDVGGTFTDCLGLSPAGREHFTKVLSTGIARGTAQVSGSRSFIDPKLTEYTGDFWNGVAIRFLNEVGTVIKESKICGFDENTGNFELADGFANVQTSGPANYEIDPGLPSPILGIHQLTQCPITSSLGGCDVFLGTTKGTNALLTRSGAKTGLITSTGLRDFLTIGDQTRPHLFHLNIQKPVPLFSIAVEIEERVLFDGTVEQSPNPDMVFDQLMELQTNGIESIAVCLMHGYKFPAHEQLVGKIARSMKFRDVRLSSEVAPLIKLIPRGETTVLDAYLNPVLADYLDLVQGLLGTDSRLQLMTSAGTLTDRELFSGKDSVLSGPAGGVVGSARIAQQVGFDRAIGFDMGGTSTDVSRFDGEFELEYETEKANVKIMTPVMAIETVAAGGGSVCGFDGTRLTVGPESAGADPGPACYGGGGPLTITDINLFLGRLDLQHFPFPLSISVVRSRLNNLAKQVAEAGSKKSVSDLASGFLEIANHNMASAIRTVSVARGFDPREYAMVSFGGAGGQHCCGVAENLDIHQILLHPKSSILSALGIQLANQSIAKAISVLQALSSKTLDHVFKICDRTTRELRETFTQHTPHEDSTVSELILELRYEGTENAIGVGSSIRDEDEFRAEFTRQHQRLFGYTQDREIEVVAARVVVTNPGRKLQLQKIPDSFHLVSTEKHQTMYSEGKKCSAGVFNWGRLAVGSTIVGPAIIGDSSTSTIVDLGWQATVLEDRQLLLNRETVHKKNVVPRQSDYSMPDPVELEIFNSSFRSIAEQMGFVLRKTSISVNIKERLDYSCAVFSRTGELVVNAPHIPVHLGAMSETVQSTITMNHDVRLGDVFATNDPYAGGSHLPDVTVLTPVFIDGSVPVFWVASRAHHAEIGGISPGSMPATATRLEQEGVLIQNFKLIEQGQANFDELRNLLSESKYPSRNPDENIADITAQVAANQAGAGALLDLISKSSLEKVCAYTDHIRDAAETKTRSAIRTIADGIYQFCDKMDDGTRIRVKLTKCNDQIEIDFSGTASVHAGNLNANRAIVSSAIVYVMRCLIDEGIPLNGGVLEPITLKLPNCFLNPGPASDRGQSPAVVGGNVETSQRIVDVLLGAIGAAAASQGTMNNWLIGDSSFGYYETVGGGSGATAAGHGADAVHCHMSNTRLTDPEILETRYPVVLREFRLRENSGGRGTYCGGEGMVRELEFSQPLTLSILSSRRSTAPFGIDGGETGASGQNILIRLDGTEEKLPSQCERRVKPGNRLRLLTPGGGGYGQP